MLPLRTFFKRTLSSRHTFRTFSSANEFVKTEINDKTGVATVTMQRLPVNSLNVELLTGLANSIDALEDNKCRGMILTSASNSVFSAGLDIMEMYKPEKERVRQFWTVLQDVWLKLYGTTFPTVAVINGHAPAGGCLLSMCCEYRIMNENFTIGLNETQLGIVAPFWFISTMQNTISKRDTELALTAGRLFKTDEALKIGLIDEIVKSKEEGLAKAENVFKMFAKVHPLARQMTKIACRGKDLEQLLDNREEDVNKFLFFVFQDKVQQSLEAYIAALKKKQKA